jgi:xanthine dehydrogenase accessory factor
MPDRRACRSRCASLPLWQIRNGRGRRQDPVPQRPSAAARIVVIGAVHISQALAPMAALAGFDMEIIDPRTAFATAERFGGTTLFAEWPRGAETAPARSLVRARRRHPRSQDRRLSAQGGTRGRLLLCRRARQSKDPCQAAGKAAEQGVDPILLERIHAPIGLPIGAASPAEIAVATLAEIIEALRSRESAGAAGRDRAA